MEFETIERCGRVHVVKNGVESAGFIQRRNGGWAILFPEQWDCLPYSRDDALDTISVIMGNWYTTTEAAARLVEMGVFDVAPSAHEVCTWARLGLLPGAVKIGAAGQGGAWRIPESALAAFAAERRER